MPTPAPDTDPTLPLGPNGSLRFLANPPGDPLALHARLRLRFDGAAAAEAALHALAGLPSRLYAEVEGLGRAYADPAATLSIEAADPACVLIAPLRFALDAGQHAALQAGADFGFGIDDDRLRVGAQVRRALRGQLLARPGPG